MSKIAELEVIQLFAKWAVGDAKQWDVYSRCWELYKSRKVTKKFIAKTAQNICMIGAKVIDMRMHYMRQLDKQVKGEK